MHLCFTVLRFFSKRTSMETSDTHFTFLIYPFLCDLQWLYLALNSVLLPCPPNKLNWIEDRPTNTLTKRVARPPLKQKSWRHFHFSLTNKNEIGSSVLFLSRMSKKLRFVCLKINFTRLRRTLRSKRELLRRVGHSHAQRPRSMFFPSVKFLC